MVSPLSTAPRTPDHITLMMLSSIPETSRIATPSCKSMSTIGGFLTDVYEDARLQNLAIREPKPGNHQGGIHKDILKKLDSMAHTQRFDTCIGGYPIPFCCDIDTLQHIYTLDELHNASIIMSTTILDRHQLQMGWPAESATGDSDIINIEGTCNTSGESTDAEMTLCTDTTLMISTDSEMLCLNALAGEQERGVNKALRKVQD